MRLNSSTQPTSTSRSPRRGSRPVVSVSRTISRISRQEQKLESSPPPRHFSSLRQNVPDTLPHGIESMGGIHDEIGALAFFGIGRLPRQDRLKFLAGHIVAGQNPLPLDFR